MLEGQLRSWISYFLGNYVDSQTLQLSTNIWSATEQLVFSNLILKPSIIPKWLPFRLKAGIIGHLHVELPISALFGRGCAKIKSSDILIVLSPIEYGMLETEGEIAMLEMGKAEKLRSDLLRRWFGADNDFVRGSNESEGYFGTEGWIGRTLSHLIDNLQVEIRNVQIRFEFFEGNDTSSESKDSRIYASAPPKRFHEGEVRKYCAVGLSLGALSAVTTDSGWRVINDIMSSESKSSRSESRNAFKLLSILDFAVYIDPNCLHFIHSSVHLKVLQSALTRLKEMGSSRPIAEDSDYMPATKYEWWRTEQSVHRHRFVITPLSATLKLALTNAPANIDVPDARYTAKIHLSKVCCSIDEDQLSICQVLMSLFSRHKKWRERIFLNVTERENNALREGGEGTERIFQEYLAVWRSVLQNRVSQPSQFDIVEKSKSWQDLKALEIRLPFHCIVRMRNLGSEICIMEIAQIDGYAHPASTVDTNLQEWQESDIRGEVSVLFPYGKTGLILKYQHDSRQIIVVDIEKNSVAAKNKALRPGLRIIRVNGKGIFEHVAHSSGIGYQAWLDTVNMKVKVITFQQPMVEEEHVDLSKVFGKVNVYTQRLAFVTVCAAQHMPLICFIFNDIELRLLGFGQSVFTFHQFHVSIRNFLVQNMAFGFSTEKEDIKVQSSYCMLSSLRESDVPKADSTWKLNPEQDKDTICADSSALMIGLDLLYDGHPGIRPGRNTHGTKYSLHVGKIVAVFDEEKVLKLWNDLRGFQKRIRLAAVSDASIEAALENVTHILNNEPILRSDASTLNSSTQTNEDACTHFIRLDTYEISICRVRFYVRGTYISNEDETSNCGDDKDISFNHSVHRVEDEPQNIPKQQLYLSLFNQDEDIVKSKSGAFGHSIFARDWIRYNSAVIILQRCIRGYLIRKSPTLRIVHATHNAACVNEKVKFGWLYKRNDSLYFCRWQRNWCYLSEDGELSVFESGLGRVLIAKFDITRAFVAIEASGRGPWGCSHPVKTMILTIRSDIRSLLGAFSDKNETNLKDWVECIQRHKSTETGTCRTKASRTLDIEHNSTFSSIVDMMRGYDSFLENGFCDTYTKSNRAQSAESQWLILDCTQSCMLLHTLTSDSSECNAFKMNITSDSITYIDQRRCESGSVAILHVGDEFLRVRDGALLPIRVTLNPQSEGQSMFLQVYMTYCGAEMSDFDACFAMQKGAFVNMSVSGWVMPLPLLDSILDMISILFLSPNGDSSMDVDVRNPSQQIELNRAPLSAPTRISIHPEHADPEINATGNSALLRVSELHVHLEAPMLEAYIEDVNCVVKLTVEKGTLSFLAKPHIETLQLNLGPTAIYILTKELSLRLAQIEAFCLEYELSFGRPLRENALQTKKAKELRNRKKRRSKPANCYRTTSIVFGQIKLEADRRLELLFALFEALTQSNEPTEEYLYPTEHKEVEGDALCDDTNFGSEKNSGDITPIRTSSNRLSLLSDRSLRKSKRVDSAPDLFSAFFEDSSTFVCATLPLRTSLLHSSSQLDNTVLAQLTQPASEPILQGSNLRPKYPAFHRSRSHGFGASLRRNSRENTLSVQSLPSFDTACPMPCDRSLATGYAESTVSKLKPLLSYQTYVCVIHSLRNRSTQCAQVSDKKRRNEEYKNMGIYDNQMTRTCKDSLHFQCDSIILEVIKQSLSVVALDTYIPVINLMFDDIKADISTKSELCADYDMHAKIGLCAQYYNSAFADWEPFIEPWRFDVIIQRVIEPVERTEQCMQKTSFCFSAMERLNINFTQALLNLLCSVVKNCRKQVLQIGKRKLAAVAADSEARKEDGRVCVLNNLGVSIRLANLNTSRRGTLKIEVRDGWSFPEYCRFHNVRVEVVLLPWWKPRQAKFMRQMRHIFTLPYRGAQSGVTPILRIAVLVENEEIDGLKTRSKQFSQGVALTGATNTVKTWDVVGTVEINLATTVMGCVSSIDHMKLTRWYRIHDMRGRSTGEVFVSLQFVPFGSEDIHSAQHADSKDVNDGQFLVFDPLKTVAYHEKNTHIACAETGKEEILSSEDYDHVTLADSLRGAYIPPLALEILIDDKRYNLLCPLKRAGKFLIQGDHVIAQVRVAQRDQSRRVLLLSSPVQLKNETEIDVAIWTKCISSDDTDLKELMSVRADDEVYLIAGAKISVPLSALYGDARQSIVMSIDGCNPRVIACLANLTPGTRLLYWANREEIQAEDEKYNQNSSSRAHGYCFLVTISSHTRKVYREDHQSMPMYTVDTNNEHVNDTSALSYATKYQILIHACLVFENTLPVRVQFQVILEKTLKKQQIRIRTGTLSPGESVRLYEFQKEAQIQLRIPEMDTLWTEPIAMAECIYRESFMRDDERHLLGIPPDDAMKTRGSGPKSVATTAAAAVVTSVQRKIIQNDRIVEFYPKAPTMNRMFEKEEMEARKLISRIDLSISDSKSPRVVLYSSLWIYNLSHVPTLLFQDAADSTGNSTVTHVSQLVPERPIPKLMDCLSHTFEMNALVDHEIAHWSDKMHSAVVGVQDPITFEFGRCDLLRHKKRFEVGVCIERPLGQFHRTCKVIVSPRFVFVNQTPIVFKVSETGKENDASVVDIEPCFKNIVGSGTNLSIASPSSLNNLSELLSPNDVRLRVPIEAQPEFSTRTDPMIYTPYDFAHSTSIAKPHKRRVFVKMAHANAQWSGPFAIDEEKEFPLRLRGGVMSEWSRSATTHMDNAADAQRYKLALDACTQYRLRVRIVTVGSTIVVTLMKDDPPMLLIRNESTLDLHLCQSRGYDSSIMLQSRQYIPFAWDRPEGDRRVTCRVSSPRTRLFGISLSRTSVKVPRLFDFENLDREKGSVELTQWFYGQSISGEVRVEKSARVLVFKDQIAKKAPQYIVELKFLSAKMKTKPNPGTVAQICVELAGERRFTEYKERKNALTYRFDTDVAFSVKSRPRHLRCRLSETSKVDAQLEHHKDSSIYIPSSAPLMQARPNIESLGDSNEAPDLLDSEEMETKGVADQASYHTLRTPMSSPDRNRSIKNKGFETYLHVNLAEENAFELSRVSDEERDDSLVNNSKDLVASSISVGELRIRIPSKVWAQNVAHYQHFAHINHHAGTALHGTSQAYTNRIVTMTSGLSASEDRWWELHDPATGKVIGQVQIAFKFRRAVFSTKPFASKLLDAFVSVPSIGISFLHNSTPTQSMIEVAYLSLHRISMLYSRVGGQHNELRFLLGNIQMDNQMDAEVVLSPKLYQVNEGVSVRVRDRIRTCLEHRYRGLLESDNGAQQKLSRNKFPKNVIFFRMLWNARCHAGEITHYELIQLALHELEVSTDEKFIVNLITVFQGLELLTKQHTFDEIVSTNMNFVDEKAALAAAQLSYANGRDKFRGDSYRNARDEQDSTSHKKIIIGNGNPDLASIANSVNQSIYVEELQIDNIRVQFSIELNGGRYIRTLGSAGRRLATYLPESNVKDLGLNLPKTVLSHVYNSQATVVRRLVRHYRHHAVLIVVRGLHTVSVYANPLRILYRFVHGLFELIRLPLRGLISGSPIELISGSYLGVRALVMNLISAGYEIVAGAAGILTIFVGPLLPDNKRRVFQEDMFGFQRSVMEEVDAFDAEESRSMVQNIVRKPRHFEAQSIGLLTIYGPGALPLEEQSRINYNAALLIQRWWRRYRLSDKLLQLKKLLQPQSDSMDHVERHSSRYQSCIIL